MDDLLTLFYKPTKFLAPGGSDSASTQAGRRNKLTKRDMAMVGNVTTYTK
jgi:hypothetical protein